MELTTNAIHISNLHYAYGHKSVLKGVNAVFPANKFSVLLGINGGGKSTLFKIIAGLLKGYQGSIHICGKEIDQLRFKDRASLIGFLPQFSQSVFSFTVEEILLTGRTAFSGFSPRKMDRELAHKILEDLAITHLRNKSFTHLSGGEQQIVMIGRLLMQNPKILLLDEPTNHLDVYYQHYLMEKLKTYSENDFTVIAIMHNPTLAFQYADHFSYLHQAGIHTPSNPTKPDVALLERVYKMSFVEFMQEDKKFVLPFGEIKPVLEHSNVKINSAIF